MEENLIIFKKKSDYTITERSAIKKALGLIETNKFLPSLESIGLYIFNGDSLSKLLSLNNEFEIGGEYPVYENPFDKSRFVITKNGTPRKLRFGVWKLSQTFIVK